MEAEEVLQKVSPVLYPMKGEKIGMFISTANFPVQRQCDIAVEEKIV